VYRSAEERLSEAIAQGQPCDFSANNTDDSLDKSDSWGPERTISAAMLRGKLLATSADGSPVNQPLRIIGARITGVFDFRAVSFLKPLYFVRCVFVDAVDFTDAALSTVWFEDCKFTEFHARYTEFKSSLLLRGCQFSGPLNLMSASVSRDVDLRHAKFNAGIFADRIKIGGSLYMRDEFACEGKVSLEGARIEAALDGIGGTFRNKDGVALFLNSATIGSFCELAHSRLETGNGDALSAVNATVTGFCGFAGASAIGRLRLRGIQIGANLNLAGVTVEGFDHLAIDLERANVAGNMFLRLHGKRFPNIVGRIFMQNAVVDGAIAIVQAKIAVETGQNAIMAEGANVGGYLSLARSTIEGKVMFRDARIGTTVNMTGTKILAPGQIALDLERARIGGALFIRAFPHDRPEKTEFARIVGGVNMTGMRVEGSILVRDRQSIENGDKELNLNQMRVSGALEFSKIVFGQGRLSLANSKVAVFVDNSNTWPKPGALLLNGFEYDTLEIPDSTTWKERLDWLRRFKPFNPQPYVTLAKVLRQSGHDSDAKNILINRHRDERRSMRWWSLWRPVNFFMDITCGHGYRPWLAAVWVGLFVLIGWHSFNLDFPDVVPLKEPAVSRMARKEPLPGEYPKFSPFVYSADVLLPIVNLQQKDYWALNDATERGRCARWYLPIHILAGWFFTTLFVVGVTGLIRRE